MHTSAVSARHAPGQSRRALMFFAVAAGAALLSACLAAALSAIIGRTLGPRILVFPAAFWVSTTLLAAGSVAMQCALAAVKLERQTQFRRWLWCGWSIGIAFVGVQSYALWCIMPADRTSQAAQSGATAFILALATLHAL